MKLLLPSLVFYLLFVSCNTDDKIALQLVDEKIYGATIKTKQINSDEFNLFDLQSKFSVELEIQDQEDGGFFDRIEIYTTFLDRSFDGSVYTSQEFLSFVLTPDMFFQGPDLLPRIVFETTFEELLEATQTPYDNVACKDQFILRAEIVLKDGRSFTTGGATSDIIAFDTFFSSPYCYTINIVEPIGEDDFTGVYFYESVLDPPLGPSFGEARSITIEQGRNTNMRRVAFGGNSTAKKSPYYEFTIACDESVYQKNQLIDFVCGPRTDPKILSGPDVVYAQINPEDDSVFEVWLVEGYLGWDGQCGFGTAPSRIRFTKQ